MTFSMVGPNVRIELTHQESDDLLEALAGGVAASAAALAGFGGRWVTRQERGY
jgi:hypothetical protein